MRVSNPAVLVRRDASIYVFGRLRDAAQVNRGIAFTARKPHLAHGARAFTEIVPQPLPS